MKRTESILFIAPVDWEYYPYRDQELPTALAGLGKEVVYLNPVKYKGYEQASRFARVNPRKEDKHIRIINRRSPWRKNAMELIRENFMNIRDIRKNKPQAVISTDHLMSAGACLYCRMKGIRFVFDVTDDWERVDKSAAGRLYRWCFKPLLARFSFAVTASSQRQYNYFAGKRRKRTWLIPNGVNPAILQKLSALEDQSIDSGEVNFIGSLRDWYDFKLMFTVFARFPKLKLHIYGDGPLLSQLEKMAASIPNIELKGNIENALTPELLKRSLFGILPLKMNTLNESTCPIKLFDYWAAGKAVVTAPLEEVSRIGGNTLLYGSDETGFAASIQKLLDDKILRDRLGEQGRKKVEEIHNYTRITNQFLQILETH